MYPVLKPLLKLFQFGKYLTVALLDLCLQASWIITGVIGLGLGSIS